MDGHGQTDYRGGAYAGYHLSQTGKPETDQGIKREKRVAFQTAFIQYFWNGDVPADVLFYD